MLNSRGTSCGKESEVYENFLLPCFANLKPLKNKAHLKRCTLY